MSHVFVTPFGFLTLLAVLCSVYAYENVYDLIERRNERRYFNEPGYFEARERIRNRHDRFGPMFDRKPFDDRRLRRPNDFFGNGYDNLGNGIYREWDRFRFFGEPGNRYHRWYHHPPSYHPSYFAGGLAGRELGGRSSYAHGGRSGSVKADSLTSKNEDANERRLSENYRNNRESVNTESGNSERFDEKSHADNSSENKSTIQSNRVAKKGHVTKGFSTHHHKDETGNTTTFYDEVSDHGGQSDFKDVVNGYGMKAFLEQVANREDGKIFRENGGQSGNYGDGYERGDRKIVNDFISRDDRFDDGEKLHSGGGKDDINRSSLYDGRLDPDRHYGYPYDGYNGYY